MPKYRMDPRWIELRYPAECMRCNRKMAKGERAFYYPNGKAFYCDSDTCGRDCAREFFSAAAIEDGRMG